MGAYATSGLLRLLPDKSRRNWVISRRFRQTSPRTVEIPIADDPFASPQFCLSRTRPQTRSGNSVQRLPRPAPLKLSSGGGEPIPFPSAEHRKISMSPPPQTPDVKRDAMNSYLPDPRENPADTGISAELHHDAAGTTSLVLQSALYAQPLLAMREESIDPRALPSGRQYWTERLPDAIELMLIPSCPRVA
jgi:hypothetical protein